jgi:hypothetical protein
MPEPIKVLKIGEGTAEQLLASGTSGSEFHAIAFSPSPQHTPYTSHTPHTSLDGRSVQDGTPVSFFVHAPSCEIPVSFSVQDERSVSIKKTGDKDRGVSGGARISVTEDGKGKSFVSKGLFAGQDITEDGDFMDHGRKGMRRELTSRSLERVNRDSAIEVFTANLAGEISPGLTPRTGLLEVADERTRFDHYYGVMSEDLSAGENEFGTLDELSPAEVDSIDKKEWEKVFQMTILFNDQDMNKKDNIGVVKLEDGRSEIRLFDLGHVDPTGFPIDPITLLPKDKNLFWTFVLLIINIFCHANNIPGTFTMDPDIMNRLTVAERRDAIESLLARREEILGYCDELIESFPEDTRKTLENLKKSLESRFKQLESALDDHKAFIENIFAVMGTELPATTISDGMAGAMSVAVGPRSPEVAKSASDAVTGGEEDKKRRKEEEAGAAYDWYGVD